MEEVLTNSDKIILDSKAAGNVLPYLPLDKLSRGKTGAGDIGGRSR
jgi:hypothetical protein